MRYSAFRLYVLAIGAAFIALPLVALYQATRDPAPEDYRIYHIPHGTAYCGRRTMTNCGIHLEHCTDDRVYDCLHNVMVEEGK